MRILNVYACHDKNETNYLNEIVQAIPYIDRKFWMLENLREKHAKNLDELNLKGQNLKVGRILIKPSR